MRVEIHPVPADLALEWLDNSQRIVRRARQHRADLSVELHVHRLELLETLLGLWKRIATDNDTFTWSADVEEDRLVGIAEEWLLLAAMNTDDLETLDCQWGHPRTLPVFDAILDGLTRALRSSPTSDKLGRGMQERPPGRDV